jgi:hypothetical protein
MCQLPQAEIQECDLCWVSKATRKKMQLCDLCQVCKACTLPKGDLHEALDKTGPIRSPWHQRESYDSGVMFVSAPRLHVTWLVGWTAELVQHSGYDGHAHTLRTQFNYWHPAAPYDWWQTIEDCGPLIHFLWLLSNWQRTQNGSQIPAKISLINSRVLHEVNAADKAMSAISSVSHHFENQ